MQLAGMRVVDRNVGCCLKECVLLARACVGVGWSVCSWQELCHWQECVLLAGVCVVLGRSVRHFRQECVSF